MPIVETAAPWFSAAERAREQGHHVEAFGLLMNAFNHTENALAAVLQAATFRDQPPMSGRKPMTLDEMRDELAAIARARP